MKVAVRLMLFTLSFLLFPQAGRAQGAGKVQGILWDTAVSQPVGSATLTIFRMTDSAIVNFTVSGRNGMFEIDRLPLNVPLRMLFSHVSYSAERYAFTLTEESPEKNFDTLRFDKFVVQLKGVEITGEAWDKPPISIKGDTVSFHADAFLNRPGTVVEDLLKRIPGIEFGESGVTFNGRKVSRILLDGREFFGSDPTVLLKNIPSAMIENVQITEEKDEFGKLTKKGNVSINVTLKPEAKKGSFGKVFGGYGTTERYEAGGLWNVFKDTMQVSFIGFANNLSQPGFAFSDLYKLGGFNRQGLNSVAVGNSLELNGISFGGGRGVTESFGGGINFSHVLFNKIETNLSCFSGGNITNLTARSVKSNFFTDSTLINNARNSTRNMGNVHNVNLTLKKSLDSLSGLVYRGRGKVATETNRLDLEIQNFTESSSFSNTINNLNRLESRGYEYRGELYYYRKLNKKSFFNLSNTVMLNGSRLLNRSNQEAFAGANRAEEETFTQRRNDKVSELSVVSRASYSLDIIEDVSIISIDYEYGMTRYRRNILSSQLPFGGQDFTIVDALSGVFNSDFNEHKLTFDFDYETESEIMYGLYLGANALQVVTKSYTRQDWYVRPTINLDIYKFGNKGNFNFYFEQQFKSPDMEQMMPILNNVNPRLLTFGNELLEPVFSHDVGFDKSWRKMDKGFHFSFRTSNSLTENPVMFRLTYDELGRENSTFVNYKDRNALSSNNRTGINKTFKYKEKWTFPLGFYVNAGFNRGFQEIGGEVNTSDLQRYGFTTNLSVNRKDIFEFTNRYTLSDNRNKTTISEDIARNISHSLVSTVWLQLPKGFSLEYDYTLNYQPFLGSGLTNGYNLLHIALNKSVFKDKRGIIKLSVFDMLNQNVAIHRAVSQNHISESETNAVVRYFMLSFVYNMNNMKASERSKSFRENRLYWW